MNQKCTDRYWLRKNGAHALLQGSSSTPDFNATHPAFAPASWLPWLDGSFPGAYTEAAAADPFLQLVQSTAFNSTIARLSGNQVCDPSVVTQELHIIVSVPVLCKVPVYRSI